MMIAIISDVHGNYPALMAVLNKIDELGCERIISLGDVSGYYCMVNECIDKFRKRGITNILGNHDYYVLGLGECPRSYTVNRITEYQRKVITKENLEFLSNSIPYLDDGFISARHGGWNDPLDEYVKEFDFERCNGGVKLYCSGHSHIQSMDKKDGITYFNPGSVGQPRDNDNRAAFAVIDGSEVKLFRVEYNIDEIAERMKEAGFDERTYNCLYNGTKIGG